MKIERNLKVGVLLATYNGSRYVEEQIASLKSNSTAFCLHWLDDLSTDRTRDTVRKAARSNGIELCEWHQTRHLGIPSAFFQLLECVGADIYLFCDQDDIWQPGKIDATVEGLAAEFRKPALVFTDSLVFEDGRPGAFRRPFDFGPAGEVASRLKKSHTFAFTPGCASGLTQGFTRPLRDIFLRHVPIARDYAFMHDWWLYDVATASGSVQMLPNAPKALYRSHQNSFCATSFSNAGKSLHRIWTRNQKLRRLASRHAQGLIKAAPTMPSGPRLDQMLEQARLIVSLDQRQSAASAIRLACLGFMPMYSRLLMAANCLFSSATNDRN